MTHELLQTDIELAIRLRQEQRPDDQIIRALFHRGVDPALAAQLIEDLRSGRKVTAHSPLPQELHLRRRSRSASKPAEPGAPAPAPAPEPAPPAKTSTSRHHRHRESPHVLGRVLLALAAVALVGLGFFLYQRYQDKAFPPAEASAPIYGASDTAAPVHTAVAPATQETSPAPLLLELQPDGLRIAGKPVTRETLLPALRDLLGAPNRTNQVAQTGVVIYAYDRRGLLVYSQPGGGTNSIVLDCEATGGVNGTTAPFAGALKLDGRVIRPDMTSQELAALKELTLQDTGGSGTVWNGRYHGLDLVFAYLRSPGHLSLIEIDLK